MANSQFLRRHYPDQVTGSLVAPTSQPMGSPRDDDEYVPFGPIAQALPEAAVAGVFDSFVTNNMINTNNYT